MDNGKGGCMDCSTMEQSKMRTWGKGQKFQIFCEVIRAWPLNYIFLDIWLHHLSDINCRYKSTHKFSISALQVADSIVFLASNRASFITGEYIGGISLVQQIKI